MNWMVRSFVGFLYLAVFLLATIGLVSTVVFHLTLTSAITSEQVSDGVVCLQGWYSYMVGGNFLAMLGVLGRYGLPAAFDRLLEAAEARRGSRGN